MTDLATLQAVAEDAATIGARMLADGLPGRVTTKIGRDYASDLDYAIERAIRQHLAEATPEIGFLGEEEGQHGEDSGMVWVLDPIDGTSNMLHGLPICGVSLGLLDRDQPVLGVIDLPFLSERFTARTGSGAYLNGQPIRARENAQLGDAIISLGDFATGPDSSARNRQRLAILSELAANIERIRMLGSAATDLAWVAAGRLDASIMLSNKPWDVTAGITIAREAGATVIDIDGADHTINAVATISVTSDLRPALSQLLAEHAALHA